jgi:hypothetical protein
METVFTALISASVMAAIVTALLNLLFKSKLEKITNDLKNQSEQLSTIFRAQYNWKEKSLSELLGPINMLLYRTEKAFFRLTANNKFVEAKILKESNEKIRDLLLQNGHLIPAELLNDANNLIEHFDRWLEEFEKVRGGTNPDLETPFIFVGPQGYPFPKKSADNFQKKYTEMWQEVYGNSEEEKNQKKD